MAGLWRAAVMATMQGIGSTEAATVPDRQRQVCWGMPMFVFQPAEYGGGPISGARAWPSGLNATLWVLLVVGETQPDRRAPSSVPGTDQHQSDTVACFGTMAPSLADCMYNHGACGALRLCTAPWTRICRMALPGSARDAPPPGRLGLCWRCCSVIGHVVQARVVFSGMVGI